MSASRTHGAIRATLFSSLLPLLLRFDKAASHPSRRRGKKEKRHLRTDRERASERLDFPPQARQRVVSPGDVTLTQPCIMDRDDAAAKHISARSASVYILHMLGLFLAGGGALHSS